MRCAVYVIFFFMCGQTIAEKAGKNILHDYKSNPEWSCVSEHQVKVLESSARKVGDVASVCLYDVKCTKISGAAFTPKKLYVMCKLEGDNCLDLDTCAEEQQNYEKNELTWKEGRIVGDTKPENVDKFGKNCSYSDKVGVIFRQNIKMNEKWDTMCATPVSNCSMPETLKGSFVATCDTVGTVRENGAKLFTCPPAPECLAAAIPATPALTKSEAKALTANSSRPPVTVIANSTGNSGSGKESQNHK